MGVDENRDCSCPNTTCLGASRPQGTVCNLKLQNPYSSLSEIQQELMGICAHSSHNEMISLVANPDDFIDHSSLKNKDLNKYIC